MLDPGVHRVLERLTELEQEAASLAQEAEPGRAASEASFTRRLLAIHETMRAIPTGANGLLPALQLWFALERCAVSFIMYRPHHAEELADAIANVAPLAAVARTKLGAARRRSPARTSLPMPSAPVSR